MTLKGYANKERIQNTTLSLSLSIYLSCSLPLQDSNQTTKSIKGIESSMYNLTYNKRLRMLIKSTVSSRSICFMSLFSI